MRYRRTSAFPSSPDKWWYRRNIDGELRSLILCFWRCRAQKVYIWVDYDKCWGPLISCWLKSASFASPQCCYGVIHLTLTMHQRLYPRKSQSSSCGRGACLCVTCLKAAWTWPRRCCFAPVRITVFRITGRQMKFIAKGLCPNLICHTDNIF